MNAGCWGLGSTPLLCSIPAKPTPLSLKPLEVFLLSGPSEAGAGRARRAARCDWAPGGPPPHPGASEGAGPAGCPAPGLRAPIDPAAAAPPLPSSQSRGGRYWSTKWLRGTGSSFRCCRRHLRVCGAGRRGCSPLQLEQAPLRGRTSLPCSALPPPGASAARPLRPPRAAGAREGEGRDGGGWERPGSGRTPQGKSWIAEPRCAGCTPVGPRQRRQQEGAPAGTRGRCCGGGPGCPGAKLRGAAPPGPVPSSARTSLPAPHAGSRSSGTRAFVGREDTPALVEKTFPADSVVAAVAGSRGGDLSPLPAPRALLVSVPSWRASLWGPFLAAQEPALQGPPGWERAPGQGVGRARVGAPGTRCGARPEPAP